ncbi:hypothetical protein QUB08_05570 [Microcoleus sp. BR0-C5]|uniref:hypothetical protein n=1 Tax=Microcoleus sp. BR0-C5 TaxID=2818713 RepID=UPI002FD344E5
MNFLDEWADLGEMDSVAANIHRSVTIAECGKITLPLLSTLQLVEFMTEFNPDDCPHLSRQYGSQ